VSQNYQTATNISLAHDNIGLVLDPEPVLPITKTTALRRGQVISDGTFTVSFHSIKHHFPHRCGVFSSHIDKIDPAAPVVSFQMFAYLHSIG
jgi:hypothetical protein